MTTPISTLPHLVVAQDWMLLVMAALRAKLGIEGSGLALGGTQLVIHGSEAQWICLSMMYMSDLQTATTNLFAEYIQLQSVN